MDFSGTITAADIPGTTLAADISGTSIDTTIGADADAEVPLLHQTSQVPPLLHWTYLVSLLLHWKSQTCLTKLSKPPQVKYLIS